MAITHEAKQMRWITPHSRYVALGNLSEARLAQYRLLMSQTMSADTIEHIHKATNGNDVLGNDRFAQQISENLKCRVQPGKSGRPKKQSDSDGGIV